MEALFPLSKDWRANKFISESITVENIVPGYDHEGKHVDTIVTFLVNSNKVTILLLQNHTAHKDRGTRISRIH